MASSGLALNVKTDIHKAIAKLDRAKAGLVTRVAARSMNRTIKSTRTEASKRIRERLNLKKATVDENLRLVYANPNELYAAIVASAHQIPLKEFKPYDGPDGVTVLVNREKGSIHYHHAWISRKLGDHVFQRVGTERLPIEKLYGPNVAQMIFIEGIRAAMRAKASEAWKKNFLHDLQFSLAKVGIHIRIVT